MTPVKLLSRQSLSNGLFLEFWDLSRPLAGDRWQVVVEVRVPVPVTAAILPPDLQPQMAQIIAVLGEEPVFAKQEVRQFVAQGEVAALMVDLQAQLHSSLAAYLAHPEFSARFIRKKYADIQEQKRWQR
jgi:hypothetical protein